MNVPCNELRYLLGRSARHHARQALNLFVADDLDEALQAAVSVGCAVEQFTKALIASVEPQLLVDKGDRDSILLVGGHGHRPGRSTRKPTDLRTIGAADALRLAKHLHPSLPVTPHSEHSDQIVFKVRNAASHAALVDRAELRVALKVMCRVLQGMLKVLELDEAQFWGESASGVVRTLLDEAATETRAVVDAKQAAAKRRLDQLLSPLDDAGTVLVLASLSGQSGTTSDHQEPQKCPVCKQMGWLICGVEEGAIEADFDEEGFTGQAWQERTAYPVLFECPVCRLSLQDDELRQFDFPQEIELQPNENPYEDWEPDEDEFRGR
jgi:hypothetical protein